MEKYYLKNGKEVKVGDVITKASSKKTEYGVTTVIESFTLTESSIPALIAAGVITVRKNSETNKVPMLMIYYIDKITERKGWSTEETYKYLNMTYQMLPAAAFSIMLREIAVELDKQYEDHIKNSSEIWVVSLLDGRITKVNKAGIKNYDNFAAFRSLEDARIACKISKTYLKNMFSNGKQKNKECSKVNL